MTDRLYDLLPRVHRRRDAEAGEPLRALLAVVAEQLDLVEADLRRLYDNWFIETCDEWAVPYLGDLVGYRSAAGRASRRDVADTVATRRRKGTLPLLEEIAAAVADWPARAVELRRLVAGTAALRAPSGVWAPATADLRDGAALDLLGGAFDARARLFEAPRPSSARRSGRYGLPSVAVFVWRLRPFSITHAPAYSIDRARNLYTFSILGNDVPLVAKPIPEPSATHIATADNVPVFIRRRALQDRLADFYGPGKSFAVWRDGSAEPIPLAQVVVADLSGWAYRARRGQVVVDPELGRIAFGSRTAPRGGVRVTYHHVGVSEIGGGEYARDLAEGPRVYRVGGPGEFERITDAYQRWRADGVPEGIIEISGSGAYQEQLEFTVGHGDRLEIRAAEGSRPVLRLLDWYSNRPDSLHIRGPLPEECADDDRPPGRVTLDGLLITGRGVSVTGVLGALTIRHSTLVPGWAIEPQCRPAHPEEPSLVLENTTACVRVSHSVLGTILVVADEVRTEPLPIFLTDSVLDATGREREALSAPECRHAHAVLHARRSTVIGEIHTHAVRLGEDSIFDGRMNVARRGMGCLRFSAVPAGSRTPVRYACTAHRPRFTSVDYGTPAYLQLAADCPPEIARGAEDGSEMGVHHDLYQPQRADALAARLAEFSPADTDAGIVYVT
ncbi:hypothetical protein [Catenuloplanes atrovinosus]|uniref:Uncharacterized protein n=1 Tax=Catenuloplanes atrovinosus TaxID=137266 RepID=A0AAE3YL60_9ACTN|nr:hypothetical protein [Catenuloplanes atrovinosus]MDR7275495.1 hypothetical protein [Catenuloplanes atrovinosus]